MTGEGTNTQQILIVILKHRVNDHDGVWMKLTNQNLIAVPKHREDGLPHSVISDKFDEGNPVKNIYVKGDFEPD